MVKKNCRCGESIEPERIALGHFICMDCGEERARRKVWTVVPLHKSNYIPISCKDDLKNIDPKHRL